MRAVKRHLVAFWTVVKWLTDRTRPPPPPVKQWIVRKYGRRHGLNILVETGTYQGEMIAATKRSFTRIISVELDAALNRQARRRFLSDPHVELHQGDSATVLRDISSEVLEPCLFWLDAHYSEGATARSDLDTPIMAELAAVVGRNEPGDIILIDDARLFTGRGDYPTLKSVEHLLEGTHLHRFEVKDDIVRISG